MDIIPTPFGQQVKRRRTKENFCCQRVPPGGPFCQNVPTHDVDTNYGFLGSLCDVHWRLLLETTLMGRVHDAKANSEGRR